MLHAWPSSSPPFPAGGRGGGGGVILVVRENFEWDLSGCEDDLCGWYFGRFLLVFLYGSFSIFDMYKGVLVCGYTRVCNHVDIRTERYSVQISTGFCARARLDARRWNKWKDRSRSVTSALARGGKICFWATYL